MLKRRIIKIQQKNKKSITALNTQNNSSNNNNQSYSISSNINYYQQQQSNLYNKKHHISNNNSNSNSNVNVNVVNNTSNNNKQPKRSNSAIGEDYYKNNSSSNPKHMPKSTPKTSVVKKVNKMPSHQKQQHLHQQQPLSKNAHSVLNNIKQPSSVFSSHIKNYINARKNNVSSSTSSTKQLNSHFDILLNKSKDSNSQNYSNSNNSSRLNSANKNKRYIVGVFKKPNSVRTSSTKLHQKIKKMNKTKQQQYHHHINNVEVKYKQMNNNIKSKYIHQLSNVKKNVSSVQNERNNNNNINNNINTKTKPSTHTKPLPSQHSTTSNDNDHDLDTTLNNNDSLLKQFNLNIDNNNNNLNSSNLNNSFDSIYSSQFDSQKYMQFHIDMTLISSYIKSFHKRHGEYPTTKMKFYKYGRLLGKGAFGKVNLSLHVLTGRLVAIKSFNKSKIISAHQHKKIIHENNIMKLLSDSNNIVKVYEMYETQKHICLVMEYICAGDLLSYIRKRNPINENICKYIFKQIILALSYIHSNNIVHRDIKLDNILIDLDNKIKICDFGVSKRLSANNEVMKEQCGTPAYMAPEIIRGNGYEGYGVDIWSAGVVLYALLSGTLPFKGKDLNELHSNIMKGSFKEIKNISKDAMHLLYGLLEVDVTKRLNCEKILCHPWLINVDVENCVWKNNLFTNAERVLLSKSNVDYRDISNRMDMIEGFTMKNLDTRDEKQNKNNQTKSVILAPFNSSNENESFVFYGEAEQPLIENNVIRFGNGVKEINRNYELNNNGEIDHGVIIVSRQEQYSNNNLNDNKSPDVGDYSVPHKSKGFTPVDKSNNNNKYTNSNKRLNEKVIKELVELGYNKQYIYDCLKHNECNYCTASYHLLNKFSE